MAQTKEILEPIVSIKNEKGYRINPDHLILSVEVTHEFNRIPTAELKFMDGHVPSQEFMVLDDDFFKLGSEIHISIVFDKDSENIVFAGIVTNKLLELNKTGPTLTIELSDEAIKMTSSRNNTVYTDKTDSDIIKTLIKKYDPKRTNLEGIESTNFKHAQMIQYYATDWDFMVSRAEANAQLVKVSNGEITVFKPNIESNPDLTLELGLNSIYDFDLKVDSVNQYNKVKAIGWNDLKQEFTNPAYGSDYAIDQGNHEIADFSKALATEETTLFNAVPANPEELKVWSDGQLLKSRLSLIKGWIKIQGTKGVKVGDTLEVAGVGSSFSGKNIIAGIKHEVTPQGWEMHLQIGMESCWFTARPNVVDTQAAGLLPGVNGLQLGVIKTYEQDAKSTFRLKVFIPSFGEGQNTVWARLATTDAGTGHGTLFIPEVGDEVIVGFLNDDPRHAIVLGSLHSSASKFPKDFNIQNGSKGIFTKSGCQLYFDEDQKRIRLATSEKNEVIIDEQDQRIILADSTGNHVELGKDGITIRSSKDCKIECKGNLDIDAVGAVTIKGQTVDLM